MIKNQAADHLTSFADHLTEQYGERGTPARKKFEKGFKTFKREALQQIPPTKKPR